MTDQPLHSEVREATAPYGTSLLARLREGLERHAAEYPVQPARLRQDFEDDAVVLRLESLEITHAEDRDRWIARQTGRPHPPRRKRWRILRTYREDDLTEEAIAAALAECGEASARIRQSMAAGLWDVPDPAPPGYEDDYDQHDWFYDLRHGFAQCRES